MEDFICFEIDFGEGLLCKENVLGYKVEVEIQDIHAFIEFPRLHPLLTRETYSSHKDLIPPFSLTNKALNFKWGGVLGINKKNDKATYVNTALLICPLNEDQTEENVMNRKDNILHAIDSFIDHLRVISREPLVKLISENHKIISIQKNRIKAQEIVSKDFLMLSQDDFKKELTEFGISCLQMEKAVRNCFQSNHKGIEEIPLTYNLLNEARKLFYQKKYRSAVFECASSAEFLATSKLDNHIKEDSSNSLKKKFKNCNGLRCKYKLASNLGLFIKNYDLDSLVELRNNAIHAGNVITRREAQEALRIADDFVYSEITYLFK